MLVQNQSGNHPRNWDRRGVVVAALPFRQYQIMLDGSRRMTLRNRKFLRAFVPLAHTTPTVPLPAPRPHPADHGLHHPQLRPGTAQSSLTGTPPSQTDGAESLPSPAQGPSPEPDPANAASSPSATPPAVALESETHSPDRQPTAIPVCLPTPCHPCSRSLTTPRSDRELPPSSRGRRRFARDVLDL